MNARTTPASPVYLHGGRLLTSRLLAWFTTFVFVAHACCLMAAQSAGTSAKRELHGVYVPAYPAGSSVIEVIIDRPRQDVELFLACDCEATWNLSLGPGTRLRRVILGGAGEQSLQGDGQVRVDRYYRNQNPGQPPLIAGPTLQSLVMRTCIARLEQLTGLSLASYKVRTPGTEKPIRIDQIHDNDWLDADYPPIANHTTLPSLEFDAIHMVPVNERLMELSLGRYSLSGIIDAEPLRTRARFVAFGNDDQFFCSAHHEIHHGSIETRMTKPLNVDVAWPRAMAFDSKREKLLVQTSRGLQGIDLKTLEVSPLSTQGSPGHAGVAYDPNADTYVTLITGREAAKPPYLQLYEPTGNPTVQHELHAPFYEDMFSEHYATTAQLIYTDQGLVIVTVTTSYRGHPIPHGMRIYWVDPDSHDAHLTYRSSSRVR